MNPDQVLAALAEVYATCSSYRDTGRVVTRVSFPGQDPRTTIKLFTTAFIRPERFRFEYREQMGDVDKNWKRYIVWSTGGSVRTWWDVRPGIEKEKSLGQALATATGVSSGSAHTIPALLLPDEVGGQMLTKLREVESVGDEDIGGVACFRLQGRFAALKPSQVEWHREVFFRRIGQYPERSKESPTTVWIDRGTLLVRRIESQRSFETFSAEHVTEYEPEVGVVVGEDELRFDPPE